MTAFVEFNTAVVCLDCNAVSAAPQGKCVRCSSTAVMTLADKLGQIAPPAAKVICGAKSVRVTCKHCSEPLFDNGTVYVHRSTSGILTVETQWCATLNPQMAEPRFEVPNV